MPKMYTSLLEEIIDKYKPKNKKQLLIRIFIAEPNLVWPSSVLGTYYKSYEGKFTDIIGKCKDIADRYRRIYNV